MLEGFEGIHQSLGVNHPTTYAAKTLRIKLGKCKRLGRMDLGPLFIHAFASSTFRTQLSGHMFTLPAQYSKVYPWKHSVTFNKPISREIVTRQYAIACGKFLSLAPM